MKTYNATRIILNSWQIESLLRLIRVPKRQCKHSNPFVLLSIDNWKNPL